MTKRACPQTFTTDAIAGPALLSYQIPDFYGNQKRRPRPAGSSWDSLLVK